MANVTVDDHVPSSSHGSKSHDVLTRSFHWTTAALVLILYSLYVIWEQLSKGDFKHILIVAHLSLGALLTIVLLGRLIWRSSSLSSRQAREPGLQGAAARVVHLTLYLLLIAQVLLGWNFRWAQGQPMSVFGILIPSPFGYPAGARHTIAVSHYWIGTAIIVLAAVHASAALFHHFVLRDDVLRRMVADSPEAEVR